MPFFLLKFLGIKKYIMELLPVLIRNWKIVLIALMAGALIYQNTFETRWLFGSETIPSLEKRLNAAEDAFYQCKEGNDRLADSIDARNNEVHKWKNISDSLQDDIAIIQQKLKIQRKKTNTQVSTILNDATPQSCGESIQYLKDGVKDLKW